MGIGGQREGAEASVEKQDDHTNVNVTSSVSMTWCERTVLEASSMYTTW